MPFRGRAEDGTPVRVDAPDGAAAEIADRWPPIGLIGPDAAGAEDPDEVAFAVDGDALADPYAAGLALTRLESDLALFAADHLVGRVAVHAGLVTWHGRTLLLPGPSRSGKSTLVLALAEQGATVHTDEYALIDPATGAAMGWPRPIRRRRADGGTDRVTLGSADRAQHRPAQAIDLVAVLRFEGAETVAGWRPVAAPEVVHEIIANTVSARRHPDLTLDAALAVGRTSIGIGGRRGEAAGAAAALLGELDALAPRP